LNELGFETADGSYGRENDVVTEKTHYVFDFLTVLYVPACSRKSERSLQIARSKNKDKGVCGRSNQKKEFMQTIPEGRRTERFAFYYQPQKGKIAKEEGKRTRESQGHFQASRLLDKSKTPCFCLSFSHLRYVSCNLLESPSETVEGRAHIDGDKSQATSSTPN